MFAARQEQFMCLQILGCLYNFVNCKTFPGLVKILKKEELA